MDNRFGVKDFFLFGILSLLVVIVILAMVQYDRQYRKILAIEGRVSQLTTEVAGLSRGGVAQTSVGRAADGGAAVNVPADQDPFYLVKAAEKMEGYATGDWLVYNFGIRVGKITPIIPGDVYGAAVQSRVLESLIVRDPNTTKWQPQLAESYTVSPDGLSVTYKLRKNVKFSDGVPFTSADVKFTFDWIMNPEVDAARSRSYLTDQGVTWETPDDYTVVFHLTKPYFEFLQITGATLIIPKHIYSKYSPRDFNDNPGLLAGTGPYRMEGPDLWRPGQRLVLYRNERYWGPKPSFNRIVYYEVSEETVYATMLRNRQLDYTGVTPEQFDKMRKDPTITAGHDEFKYQSMLGGYTYVAWNQDRQGKKTPFADKRVRQAMTMLLDRERLANEIYSGYATVASGPFSSKGPQSDPSIKPLPYDPERAKKLLAEAGWKDRDGDGILEDEQGNPFKFEFMHASGSAMGNRIALFMKDQLARGGVLAELKPTDWPVMIERLKKGQYDVTSLGWSSSVEGDLYQIFHSSQRGDAGDNRTNYANPELDKLIVAARSEVDEAKRMELWKACHRILAEDQPYTFLLERQSLAFYDKRIKNIQTTAMGTNFLPTEPRVPPWFVPADQQLYTKD